MEQGLGKTFTTLEEFNDLVIEGLATRLLILCPNSFKKGWAEEVEKHGFNFHTHVYDSKRNGVNKKFLQTKFNKPPVVVMNYESIRGSKGKQFISDFIDGRIGMIVADESILISTHDSDQTKAAIAIAKNFDYRRILSGKYIKKGPHDLWSQWRFIGKLNGWNYHAFKGRFCLKGGFRGKDVVGIRNEAELQGLMEEYAFVARKTEWMDSCPAKLYTIRDYEMPTELQVKFMEMFHEFMTEVNDDVVVTVDQAITKYMKMAQIQAGFIIDQEGKAHNLVPIGNNPRLNALRDFIDNELAGKIIIPYHHRHAYVLLMEAFGDLNPAYITGGMKDDDISEQKRRFNEDPECRAIFLQTRASKYGHTLLGIQNSERDFCCTMAFFENTYSLDDRSQIEDRNHRHGQVQEHCSYVDFVSTVIDRKMIKALQLREQMFLTIAGVKDLFNSVYGNLVTDALQQQRPSDQTAP